MNLDCVRFSGRLWSASAEDDLSRCGGLGLKSPGSAGHGHGPGQAPSLSSERRKWGEKARMKIGRKGVGFPGAPEAEGPHTPRAEAACGGAGWGAARWQPAPCL